MAIIETKFSVGDVVYSAGTVTERKRHPCPDCLGEKKWASTSPAGGEFTFPCPRCSATYRDDRDISLEYTSHEPVTRRLTIGSIQVNTHSGSYDHGNRYMCVETGIGSGSVYDEKKLFDTKEKAMEAAKLMAAEANQNIEWVATQYNKSLSISDFQLESAKIKMADETASHAKSTLWNLSYLFGEIEEAADKQEIMELIEYYREYDWQRDKDKIAEATP